MSKELDALQRATSRYRDYLLRLKRRDLVDEVGHLRSVIADLRALDTDCSEYIQRALCGKDGIARGYELKATYSTYEATRLNTQKIRADMDDEWVAAYSVTTTIGTLKFTPL